MKKLLKISLACLCLLFSGSVLKAQSCGISIYDIDMSETHTVTSTKVYTTVKVTTAFPVFQIAVGNKVCTSPNLSNPSIQTCTGGFVDSRECYNTYSKSQKCYVTAAVGCSAKQDGCVVVIAGRHCSGGNSNLQY